MVPDRFQKIFRGVVQIWQKLLLTMENEDQMYGKKFCFGLVLQKIYFLFEKIGKSLSQSKQQNGNQSKKL